MPSVAVKKCMFEIQRVILVVLMVAFARVALAQSSDATILGQVMDDSGAVMPGVTVTVSSDVLQVKEVSVVTDGRGEYRITPLPIGVYSIRYELQGFTPALRDNVRLTVGFIATINITLKLGTVSEAVTVSGASPVVDVTRTTTSTELPRETLELLPTTRNSLITLSQQAPGVRTSASNMDVGGSKFTSTGSTNSYGRSGDSTLMLEGVWVGGGSQSGVYFDFATYQEAQVVVAGSNAEVSGSGTFLNVILKSGANTFHGNVFYGPTWPAMQSSNIDEELARKGVTGGNELLGRYDVSADFSGRIIRDKLWFYSSGRYAMDDGGVIGAFKADGVTPATQINRQYFQTYKLSYQMTPSNRFTAFTQPNTKKQTIASPVRSWGATPDLELDITIRKAEWQGILGKSTTANVSFGQWGYHPLYIGRDFTQPLRFDLGTQRYEGGAAIAQFFTPMEGLQDRKTTIASISSYKSDLLGGNHTFKAGINYSAAWYDWRYGDRGDAGNYYLRFRNGAPLQVAIFNTAARSLEGSNYTAVYAQDDWQIGRLSLSLGARWERNTAYMPEQTHEAGDFFPAATFPAVEFNEWNAIAPRLHFAWDVTGQAKTVIKGGWGRFNKLRYPRNDVDAANPNTLNIYTFNWRDLNGNRLWDAGEVNLDPNGPDFLNFTAGGLTGTGGALRLVNPDERQPITDEFSWAAEHELVQNLSVRISGAYSRESRLRRLRNINRPPESYTIPITNRDPGPDGRVGTGDDGGLVTYYEYPTSLRGSSFQTFIPVNTEAANTYNGYELTVTKRMANNWQVLATYGRVSSTLAKYAPASEGQLAGEFIELTPNADIFGSGTTTGWYGKVGGSYRIGRLGLLASANLNMVSGDPFQRTVLFSGGTTIPTITLPVEPLGEQYYPSVTLLDLRAEKDFTLRGNHRFKARIDLFNALNTNKVITQIVQSGASYLLPTAIMPPRIAVFGLSYSF